VPSIGRSVSSSYVARSHVRRTVSKPSTTANAMMMSRNAPIVRLVEATTCEPAQSASRGAHVHMSIATSVAPIASAVFLAFRPAA
jgi:hypothetical protein